VGPFIAIGSIFGSKYGPIPEHRWHLSEELLGLFMTAGRFFRQQPWAHTSASAASLEEQWAHSLPLVVFSAATMGPSQSISSISQEKWWASLSIGRFFRQQPWARTSASAASLDEQRAHSLPLVVFSAATTGPSQSIGSISQETWWASLSIGRFFRQQRWARMSALAASQDEQRAHSLPSVVFFVSNNGPIQAYREHLGTNSRTIQNHW
jgi:hypothetical protein